MINEPQTTMITLHITDELLAHLHPFMAGLGIHVTPHSTQCEQHVLRLTMHAEIYATLVERVGSALDYEVRWRPNEYEADGFVERVRPLELTNGLLVASGCPQCGAQMLANHIEVCVWSQIAYLI